MSFWNILFSKNDNGQNVTVQAKSDEFFAQVAFKFIQKAGITDQNSVKYLYNNQELKINSPKTLAELNLRDRSKIDVVMTNTVIGA